MNRIPNKYKGLFDRPDNFHVIQKVDSFTYMPLRILI